VGVDKILINLLKEPGGGLCAHGESLLSQFGVVGHTQIFSFDTQGLTPPCLWEPGMIFEPLLE
jgi:hypothetical protein